MNSPDQFSSSSDSARAEAGGLLNPNVDPEACETRPDNPVSQGEVAEYPTVLQRYVEIWDQDNDGVVYPWDIYKGFRELGFNIFLSFSSLLIPVLISYPTQFAHGWLPDPLLRIYAKDVGKVKAGARTSIYDLDGNFNPERFDELFNCLDTSASGWLTARNMFEFLKRDRCGAGPTGWGFSFLEWWMTWLLLQEDGMVWKDDLRALYDGSFFYKVKREREWGFMGKRSYAMRNFFNPF